MDYRMSGIYIPGEISEIACWIDINNNLIDSNSEFLKWAQAEIKKIARSYKKKKIIRKYLLEKQF